MREKITSQISSYSLPLKDEYLENKIRSAKRARKAAAKGHRERIDRSLSTKLDYLVTGITAGHESVITVPIYL